MSNIKSGTSVSQKQGKQDAHMYAFFVVAGGIFQRYLVFSLRFEIQIWFLCFYGMILSSYGFVCRSTSEADFTFPINQC